jgi:RNA polymerase sigma factor (sigma-70 family)
MEDSKIIDLYWERNEKAISATEQKYGSYCYYIAYNILHDQEDAEESVNDTYLGAWNAIPPHRPNMLRTFLGKITRSISLKKWRDAHRDKRGGDEVSLVLDELSECVPSNLSVEDSVIAGELSVQINRFLGTLAPTERQVLLCRYWYLDPIDKISADFCFSNSKVKSMLHRTRAKLRAYLEKEGVL